MGISCAFVRVGGSDLDQFLDDAESFVFDRSGSTPVSDQEADRWIRLQKGWHALEYLINKATGRQMVMFPDGLAVAVTEDTPICYLDPSQVKRRAALLGGLSFDDLASCYDPRDMEAAEIYPVEIWRRESRSFVFPWLQDQYTRLVTFFAGAAAAGDGIASALM